MTKRRLVGAVAVLGLALAARLVWLSDEFNVNEPDELMHVSIAERFAGGTLYPRYDPGGYRDGLWTVPALVLYCGGAVFRVFGASLWHFRLMSVGFGLAGVAAFYAFSGLYLKGVPRLVAVLLFAFSPLSLYGTTLAMLGFPSLVFLLTGLWAYVRYHREGRRRDLVVCALMLGATAATKHYGLLLGGLIVVHWCWVRVLEGGPPLRGLAAVLGLALGTFIVLEPWVLWRPRDAVHCYLYRLFVSHLVALVRGQRGSGSLFGVPYPELVVAHGLVGLVGLVAFVATWRRRWDAAGFYAVLLGVPILAFRETRYLSLSLPIFCLFAGYLVAVVGEAGRRSRLARVGNGVLVAMLVGSLVPVSVVPWRPRSGLVEACRFVAEHTAPDDQVVTNYWRPIVERFTGRRVASEWLDGESRRRIEGGGVRFVILDGSQYTRRVLHTPERAAAAAWVRRTFPAVWSPHGEARGGTTVYATGGGGSGGG